jgi:hypothetical protein
MLAPRLAAGQTAPIRTNGLHACVTPNAELRNFHTRSKFPHSLRLSTGTYFEVRRKFDRSADRLSSETRMSERRRRRSCRPCRRRCCYCYYYYYYYYYYCYYYYYYYYTCALRYGRMCRCCARMCGPYPEGVLQNSHLRNAPICTGCVIL